jgi:hypothetical protein
MNPYSESIIPSNRDDRERDLNWEQSKETEEARSRSDNTHTQ